MKQSYIHGSSFDRETINSSTILEAESNISVISVQHDQFKDKNTAFSLLCTIALKRLTFDSSSLESNMNICCDNNDNHSVRWINLHDMTEIVYPLEKLEDKLFLLLTFIPQSLQQLYYNMIISPNHRTDTLPLVVLLSQCLIFLEHITENNWNYYLALSILYAICKEHLMENYVLVLFWKDYLINGIENNERKEFINVIEAPNDWETLINVELQRICKVKSAISNEENDLKLFAASITLARLFQVVHDHRENYRTKNIHLSCEDSEQVRSAILSIEDPTLRIIALSIILNMKNPYVFNDENRYQLQLEMIQLFHSLLPDFSLLKSTLLFVECNKYHERFPDLFEQITIIIGKKLNETSTDKQNLDQEAAYVALRQLNNVDLEHHLLQFVKGTKNLSKLYLFNSNIFYRYFNDTTLFQQSTTILLPVMYLVELAFDAQFLRIYTDDDPKSQQLPWTDLRKLWDDSSKYQKVMTFEASLWITNYLSISNNKELDQVMRDVSCCLLIERKALVMVEKWLNYRTNQQLKFFAQYAALQVVKEGVNIFNSIDLINEIFNTDYGFRLKSIVECHYIK